jgi:hypothetical protein
VTRYINVGDYNVITVRSGNHGQCVGVSRPSEDVIEVRHTKREDSPVMNFTPEGWKDVLMGLGGEQRIKLGRDSMPIDDTVWFDEVRLVREGPDTFVWYSRLDTTTLTFTCAEMDSFIDGVCKNEFELASV